ncbi:MAG: hypothetical protein IJC78_02145 [Clostridia bacterium]|nr:hypothetical protein [Clostridia bacterium]
MKYSICILIIIASFCNIICGCNKKEEDVVVRTHDGLHKEIDRELTVKDFEFIEKGDDILYVIYVLGEPNGLEGSGILRPYYCLKDRSIITILEDANGVYAMEQSWVDKEGKRQLKWLMSP